VPPLHIQLRNRLEAAVKQARRTAEAAAKVAVERLTVGSAEPGTHLSVDERQLRNRLRAHGRQLGDGRDPKTGTQSINRLIHECAYEHWHRMLFARFLAENHLLIHDKEMIPVTLAECDELAADEGAPDGWTLAARYAARMLPQIFRPDDPVLQVGFAPEHKRALEKLVTELPVEVFTAEDSLGWVYQFWQAERKDEVNASGDKITGETLPAVTQLFTEHYMVLFLLHNTIGAWWAARLKSEERIPKSEWDKCQTEDDCRKLVALSGYEFTYLRFIKDANGEWAPAAGAFPGWPKLLKDFKLIDPCCGSGHFLVAAFLLLVLLRMQDESLSAKDASDAVLHENLNGLELDPRCTQIAAFALALAAWKFTDGFRPLPPLNIACSGLGVNARKEDWLALANDDTRLRSGLEQLYDLFQKAPELGSLINPRRLAHGDLVTASFSEIQPLLTKALQSERAKRNDDLNEIGVAAQGMARAASLLSAQYQLVLTNVPYLLFKKQGEILKRFCEQSAADAKMDLANVFVVRCLDFAAPRGTAALVTPQNWLFLGSYKNLRERLLSSITWDWVARLGPGAFETIGGEIVNAALLSLTRSEPDGRHLLYGVDVSASPSTGEKAEALRTGQSRTISQSSQLKNPDARISFDEASSQTLLADFAISMRGIVNGDNDYWLRCFWELAKVTDGWRLLQTTVESSGWFGGTELIINWSTGGLGMLRPGTENQAYGKKGVAISRMGEIKIALYTGELYDQAVATIVPKKPTHLPAIVAYCSSPQYATDVRRIDQSLKVTNASLIKVPFDLTQWQHVAAEKYPNGLPEPDSNDPTQWLFNGRLADSTAPLQVGVALLLGYRWPRQTGQAVSGAAPMPEDGLDRLMDEDGIVCIPSVRGEAPAAERLRILLAAAYGETWSPAKMDELLSAVDYAGSNLEDWLRNGFFDQHSKLFHHRPFIWQVWDGRKDGFSALVNYHKLDHKLLEKLTYTYLGEWIKKQQEAVANEEGGADDRLVKAQQLQDKLKLILEGETPYDIFIRWKPLEQQPIGWHPDLNDGVRINIRPFMEADVLRKRPNIKWSKDRGKNPSGSPWGEERDNDRHLSLAEKRTKS
jgi:N-6 DNA Methylase